MTEKKFDLVVIGAGIVGLAHAYHAAIQGLKVVVFERNQFALGASVRNFGLIWPIGQDESHLPLALNGCETWKKLGSETGFEVNENGSLHLAYQQDELDVFQEFESLFKTSRYQFELVSPNWITSRYSHIKSNGLLGGLWSPTECTVDPRKAIKRIAQYLQSSLSVTMYFGKTVTNVSMPFVSTFDDKVETSKVIICSGQDFETLYPSLMQSSPLTKCKLQMMKTTPIPGFQLGPSLCAGLTLRHYNSFDRCPSVQKLSERYDQSNPEFADMGIHVLVSQNEAGELILGDSHEYGSDFYPFDQAEIDDNILSYLSSFFHLPDLTLKERWHGIYPKLTNGNPYLVLKPEEDVTIVNGLGGAGMTLSFGLAQQNITSIYGNKK